MTRPNVYLIRMAVFLVAVLVVAALLSPVLLTALATIPVLNSLILLVLLLGIGWNLRQVLRLSPEVTWLETYQTRAPAARGAAIAEAAGADGQHAGIARDAEPRASQARFTLSATAMRSLLDGIASRLDESRELSRYMTGLLIFLGLLGTFWGLLKTIGAVSDVIGVDVGRLRRRQRAVRAAQVRPGTAAGRHGHGVFRLACSACPARWCWAFSTSPPGRRRTASSTSWRNGWPA